MKKLLAIAICVMVCMTLVNAQSREVTALQEILKATGATWQAAETNMTRMHPLERQRLLGLMPAIGNPTNLPTPTIMMRASRNIRFETPHTGIKDQGSCGSCYSFGASATYEGWKLLINGTTYDLSEQYFLMKAKEIGPYGGCEGWYLDTSMDLLKNNGVPNESDCRYKGYESACASTVKPVHKIAAYGVTTDLDTIKYALENYGPVYCGFAVYEDFFNYNSGVYRYTSGSLQGYHAICIVGFDDATQSFKVKNSWGIGWGENGYFRIGYDQMTNDVQFGTCFGGSFYVTE